MSGVDKIAQERATHEARGYTAAVDDQWENSEIAKAAACNAVPFLAETIPWLWPWENERPMMVFNIERRIEQLAKAGALIAAEIDRLERFAARKQVPKEMSEADTKKAIAEAQKVRWPEEPQEYILIIPGQEPSGDEPLRNMTRDSAKALNYLLRETGDKRRWVPLAELCWIDRSAIVDASDDALQIVG